MIKYLQLPTCKLAEFASNVDTVFTVSGFLLNDGVTPVDPADIGDICYATLEPKTKREELISFTINSVDAAGIATITAVRGLLQKSPYTVGGASFDHQNGTDFVISNNPGLFNELTAKDNPEVITEQWSFPAPSANNSPVTKAYADALVINGGADATDLTRGITLLSESPAVAIGTATITIATPGVVSFVGHGLVAGDTVKFTTTGALPTGLVAGTSYYVIAAGLTANAFQVAAAIGGAAINTTGSQSGVHTLTKWTPVALFSTPAREAAIESLIAGGAVTFGGNGSDGVLNVASGTTTLDLSVKTVYNYTSITIAVGATLTFSGGTAGDKVPVLKCQGNFSNAGTITTVGLGIAGGAGGAAGATADFTFAGTGTVGNDSNLFFIDLTKSQGGRAGIGARSANGTGPVAGSASSGGALSLKRATYFSPAVFNGAGGAGGGGGGKWTGTGAAGAGGAGGAGSLALVIEALGSFTNTGTINTSGGAGAVGANGSGNGSQSAGSGGGGGGGGGGAGSLIIKYKGTLTASGSFLVAGGGAGTGGSTVSRSVSGGSFASTGGGGGGGGGATAFQDGGVGNAGTDTSGSTVTQTGGSGGAGGAGILYLEQVN